MANVKVPYLKPRGAHWRWEPGPALRARGAKGVTLRDGDGSFLNEQEAIAAARALNEAIANGTAAPRTPATRSIKAMFDLFRASGKFTSTDPRKRLAKSTIAIYRTTLRIIEAWCGDVPAHLLTPADIENWYDIQVEERGLPMANAILRTFKLAYNYGIDKLRWTMANPITAIEMTPADGRLVVWSAEELETIIACGDWMADEWPDAESVADAVTFGFLSGQRQGDLFTAAPLELINGAYMFRPAKTNHGGTVRRAFVPPTPRLSARIAKIDARKAARWPNVAFATALITGRGKGWGADSSEFRDAFRGVRAVASGIAFAIDDLFDALAGRPQRLRNLPFTPRATIFEKKFQDLRDTAVTLLFTAGCSVGEIANITGHSLKSVQDILDKHYFVRNEALAHSAGEKFRALLARTGMGG